MNKSFFLELHYISHLLFHCRSVKRQTGHHHLGAEHSQLQDGSAHLMCVSQVLACERYSLCLQACEKDMRLINCFIEQKKSIRFHDRFAQAHLVTSGSHWAVRLGHSRA